MARAIASEGRTVRGILTALAVVWAVSSPLAATEVRPGVEMPPEPRADAPHGEGVCAVPRAANTTEAPLPQIAQTLRESRTLRVLAIGSSSTFGVGASSERMSYPARLEGELERTFRGLDVEVVNRGVSGEVAKATARRIRLEVALQQPDLVLWQVGTNDAINRVPADDFRRTVVDIVKWLKANDVDLVLVGLQYTRSLATDPHYQTIRQVLRDVAQEEHVPLVRRFEAMQHIAATRGSAVNMMASDDFHMNDLGYQCMAQHVARAIVVSIFHKPREASATPPATPPVPR